MLMPVLWNFIDCLWIIVVLCFSLYGLVSSQVLVPKNLQVLDTLNRQCAKLLCVSLDWLSLDGCFCGIWIAFSCCLKCEMILELICIYIELENSNMIHISLAYILGAVVKSS